MSEFYAMPIAAAKTNGSYVVPTTSNSSIFNLSHSNTSHGNLESHKDNKFGRKIAKLFGRSNQ